MQSPNAGPGSIGIGKNASLHIQNSVTLSSAIYEDPSATIQIDRGSSIAGSQVKESFTASAAFAALAPTQTFSRQIQNTTTIAGNGGQNVIAINSQVSLNNGQNLLISGNSADTFVVNIAPGQNFQLQNGSGVSLKGISPTQVVFNFLGNGASLQITSNNNGISNTSGIFLDPEGQINYPGRYPQQRVHLG